MKFLKQKRWEIKMAEKTNINSFKEIKAAKDSTFVQKILEDVTGINLTKEEVQKLKVFLRYETSRTLFESIDQIYSIIGANFTKPSRFLIIPFIRNGNEHINIHKI